MDELIVAENGGRLKMIDKGLARGRRRGGGGDDKVDEVCARHDHLRTPLRAGIIGTDEWWVESSPLEGEVPLEVVEGLFGPPCDRAVPPLA
jgi:hypothetical protein